jgi:hypothetical protein
MYSALDELSRFSSCQNAHGMFVNTCVLSEHACFADPNCRQCLAALYAATSDDDTNGTKTDVLRSPACTTTERALLQDLEDNCGGATFPTCTFFKQKCTASPKCASCLATFGAGDGAKSARQCPGSTGQAARFLDNAVNPCSNSNADVCSFWHQRCADNINCSACLAGMGNGNNALANAADWSTPACRRALQDSFAVHYLVSIAAGCPGVSACRKDVTGCVIKDHGDGMCTACLDGSASPSNATFCAKILSQYSFDTVCQPCPASVHTINLVVLATASVGGTSAAACLVVATTIVAHGRDRVSMRDRIVVGLMMANAVFSMANTIPLNALRTGVVDCGRLVMSFDAILIGRSWWFCGKCVSLLGLPFMYRGRGCEHLLCGTQLSDAARCTSANETPVCCQLHLHAFVVGNTCCQ